MNNAEKNDKIRTGSKKEPPRWNDEMQAVVKNKEDTQKYNLKQEMARK